MKILAILKSNLMQTTGCSFRKSNNFENTSFYSKSTINKCNSELTLGNGLDLIIKSQKRVQVLESKSKRVLNLKEESHSIWTIIILLNIQIFEWKICIQNHHKRLETTNHQHQL